MVKVQVNTGAQNAEEPIQLTIKEAGIVVMFKWHTTSGYMHFFTNKLTDNE